jgi:hypothetical protein
MHAPLSFWLVLLAAGCGAGKGPKTFYLQSFTEKPSWSDALEKGSLSLEENGADGGLQRETLCLQA